MSVKLRQGQSHPTEQEQQVMQLTMCIHVVDTINRLGEVNTDEDKQGLAQHLFEYITYDLDRQEIVDLRLKPWAEQFLMLRAALYAGEIKDDHQAADRRVTPTGVGTAPLPSLNSAIQQVLDLLYWNMPLPEVPLTDKHISLLERNRQICERYAAGETLEEIAQRLGLSHQRVHQIVNYRQR